MTFLAQLERKWQTLASYSDWSGEWVHYSNINKIGINPQQFHMDLAGVYLFPKEFKTRGTLWREKKFKFTVKISGNAKVLDLSKLSENDLQELLDKLNIKPFPNHPLNADTFWDTLQNYYCLRDKKNVGKWNGDFRRLGYDAVFDDTGSIHTAEVQLVVLNPKIIKIIDVETQSIKRGQFDRIQKASDYLVSLLKPYGKVEVDIKKKMELYSKNAVVRATIRLHIEDGKRLDWKVSEDEANHEIIVFLDHSKGIPQLRNNWGTTRDHERIDNKNLAKIKNLVDRVMSKVEEPIQVQATVVLRPKDWQATGDQGVDWLESIKREGHVYRGMTSREYNTTVGAGKPIASKMDYSLPQEGTCFAEDPADAESYVNFGRDDPRKTGQVNYLIEILKPMHMTRDKDGYFKTQELVSLEKITRIWRMKAMNGNICVEQIR